MQTTTNYALKKIDLTDSPPDITVLNGNFDTIDSEMKKHSDDIGNKASLATTEKGSLVGAVNEVNAQLAQKANANDLAETALMATNAYRGALMAALAMKGVSTDVTYSASGVLPRYVCCNNLTISSGVTMTVAHATPTIIKCKGTFTLNGTIDLSGIDGVQNGYKSLGGSSGNVIIVEADSITGSGAIKSNGGKGFTIATYYSGAATDGGNGTDGEFYNIVIQGGQGSSYSYPFDSTPVLQVRNALISGLNIPLTSTGCGVAGTGGYSTSYTNRNHARGGSGANSCAGSAGGVGGNVNQTTFSVGGGGGGGGAGGVICLFSNSPITSAISLEAKGGVGGNGYDGGGGGGGGAGGLIHVVAPSFSGTASVSAGAGGTKGPNGVAGGGSGGAGYYKLTAV